MAKASLGVALEDLRGKVGNEVFTRGRGGLTVRAPAKYKFKLTPAMANSAEVFKQALAFKNQLTRPQMEEWNAFARTQIRHDAVTGRRYAPAGHNLYTGLTCKFLQINPGATPPVNPPSGSFGGDRIKVRAEIFGGSLTFFASGANAANVQTELLLQKLPSALRQPTDKYVSQEFAEFTGAGSGFSLSVPPGWYAPAYRFVQINTGQMTELVTLPVIEVS